MSEPSTSPPEGPPERPPRVIIDLYPDPREEDFKALARDARQAYDALIAEGFGPAAAGDLLKWCADGARTRACERAQLADRRNAIEAGETKAAWQERVLDILNSFLLTRPPLGDYLLPELTPPFPSIVPDVVPDAGQGPRSDPRPPEAAPGL